MVTPGILLTIAIHHGPLAIIALIGLVLAAVVPIRSRGLVATAMALLLVSVVVSAVWQLVGLPAVLSGRFSADWLSLGAVLVGLVSTALQITCWALVLFALFRRPPAVRAPGAPAPVTRPEWRP